MFSLTVTSAGTGICDDTSMAPGEEISELKKQIRDVRLTGNAYTCDRASTSSFHPYLLPPW